MRYLFLLLTTSFFVLGCKKGGDEPGGVKPEEKTIPFAFTETVHTKLVGYATDEKEVKFSNYVIWLNGQNYPTNGANFNTDTLLLSRYATSVILNDPTSVQRTKTIALTPASINYVRVKAMRYDKLGTVMNANGGSFASSTGAKLVIPAGGLYTVGTAIYPGYYGPDVSGDVSLAYLSPLSADFGASIPCYSIAVENGKTQFLASVGVVSLDVGGYRLGTDESEIDFYGTAKGELTLPIPTALAGAAPDTITTWALHKGLWVRSGVAKRSNNTYVTSIKGVRAYNFAVAVDGVFKTVKLRTDNGLPVVNTTIRAKANNLVVAESQTDIEGNAVVFVPAAADLKIEASKGWSNATTLFEKTVSGTAGNTIDMMISAASPYAYSLSGNATTCANTPIAKGLVTIQNIFTENTYYFPVENGSFKGTFLDEDMGNYALLAKVNDNASGATGVDTAIIGQSRVQNNFNLNTCPIATDLYMRFSVDNDNYSIVGDIANSDNPYLQGSYSYSDGKTLVATSSNSVGLQFSTHASSPGVYTGSGIDDLFINEKHYFYDVLKPMNVTFSRYDLVAGGFIIGTADFYYKDRDGVSRHVVATFKVKRST
jgi:hypothetical protein